MPEILIDTNALISFFDSSDKWYQKIISIFEKLTHTPIQIIVTDIVLNETINVLCKRYENKNKSKEIEVLIKKIEKDYNENITWISEDIKIYHKEILKLVKNSLGLLNYNDCFLISYMLKNKIKYIISYDHDFDTIKGIVRIYDENFILNEFTL